MNHVLLSGVIRSTPHAKQLGDVLACSTVLDFDDHSFIQIYALGAAARQLRQLHSGNSVRVTGRLAISPDGTLQIVATEFGLLEVVYKKIEVFAEKSA
jgi:hypothetical protein